ncbi:S41 family peptidase [Flavobacterium cellulosilyticum]|uniref:S41 family peptidase n=1 Tax=Flavobacterium cellulosilyticum TaxID=2541731 RepID=A0A4R5CJI9_9FLAO|nr:S41 family peptidase [Flavobacterium cellulosilyticum]TDD99299.1 S41 family peptidase [Flavobacterium cellulosilyticum]
MKINSKYFAILIFTVLAFGILLGGWLNFPNQHTYLVKNNAKNKLGKIIDFIDNEYVDSINNDTIINKAIINLLDQLDPHSVYIQPNKQVEFAENMKGDFVGIGVNFYILNDSVAIVKTLENGPSEKAGIKAGDRILYADQTKLFGRKLPIDSLFSKFKGIEGSEVTLTVYRKSTHKELKIKIKRGIIPIKSVDAAILFNKHTAYIKINRFAENTYDEFIKALTRLKEMGAKSLIIDLRNNGGGYLNQAVFIADELLKDRQLIVFTKSKKGVTKKIYATKKGIFESGKVILFINENSASASEILAGAIQDNDRGTIVGRRSYGKGLVQREMDFEDGSAVRLTIARYYTPTGRSIQKTYSSGNADYYKETGSRFNNGELYHKDSIKTPITPKYKTPNGRVVYGGGGIVPDIFVPIELEHGNENSVNLLELGVLSNFVFEQLDKDRGAFTNLTFDQCMDKINSSDLYFNLFQKYILKYRMDLNIKNNKAIVKRYLSAEFAGQLYNESKFYEVLLKNDAMMKAVIK